MVWAYPAIVESHKNAFLYALCIGSEILEYFDT